MNGPKKRLFEEDSDENIDIKTENEYAKKYDSWRGKEELHKLEQKYGSQAARGGAAGEDGEDSEDESDASLDLSADTEKQFLKTLTMLKTKDERIYDPNFKFFEEKAEGEEGAARQAAALSFADDDAADDDADAAGGGVFTVERRAPAAQARGGDGDDDVGEGDVDGEVSALAALWTGPAPTAADAFLRDYILHKRYLEPDGGDGGGRRDQVDVELDARLVEEQHQFERAYNFRYEEPDDDYLKRFPRTMNYIRPKDDRRARKRAEVRARKEEEKKKKMEEIARMKALKLKEIQEKIAKIKEVTGNQDLAFHESDVEGEFDPAAHDRRMRALFDDAYYGQAQGEDRKPQFPDLDEDLDIEDWERYDRADADHAEDHADDADDDRAPHCEDADFNMDAESALGGAAGTARAEGRRARRRGRRSQLARLLAEPKPRYVPGAGAGGAGGADEQSTYARHMEQYYALDCEDVIAGGLPTRFKYRQVPPNDYGLTVEEILLADDKELTQWVPLKKMLRLRDAAAEREQAGRYRARAQDAALKRRLLPSLNRRLPQEPEIVDGATEGVPEKKKRKKKKRDQDVAGVNRAVEEGVGAVEDGGAARPSPADDGPPRAGADKNKPKGAKSSARAERKKGARNKSGAGEGGLSDARLRAFGLNPKKYRGFLRYRRH